MSVVEAMPRKPLFVVSFPDRGEPREATALGLDADVAQVAEHLFAVLDFPRSGLETLVDGTTTIYWDSLIEHQHDILLIPWPWQARALEWIARHELVVCLAPASIEEQVVELCRERGWQVAHPGDASRVHAFWEALGIESSGILGADRGPPPRSMASAVPHDLRALHLTTIRALRILDEPTAPAPGPVVAKLSRIPADLTDAIDIGVETRGRVQFAYDFRRERGDDATPTVKEFEDGQLQAVRELRAPLVLGSMSNVASAESADIDAFHFLMSHRSLSSGGMGIAVNFSEESWTAVESLHRALIDTHPMQFRRPRGKDVLRSVTNIGSLLLRDMGQPVNELLQYTARVGRAPVFSLSEAPLEWCAVPGRSDPLCMIRPVVRRPVYPLTAAIQAELVPKTLVDLRAGIRVACIECIAPGDPIERGAARIVESLGEVADAAANVSVRTVAARSRADLLSALASNRDCNVCVVIAHGVSDLDGRGTGLRAGSSDVVSPGDLPFLPPIVILCACNTSVRGRLWSNIADSCLTRGALATVSASVPIFAPRAKVLVARFIRLLDAAVSGHLVHDTLLDVWHHTQATHPVHDILDSWDRLDSRAGEIEQVFKHHRSRGRLRVGSMLNDTVAVLAEVVEELGIRGFGNWLKYEGFFPESLFYSIAGWPDAIWVTDPATAPHRRRGPRRHL